MIRWLFIFILLSGCVSLLALTSCNIVCPDKTIVEIGVTATDAKNDKLQEKKSITQTWKWGKKSCKDN